MRYRASSSVVISSATVMMSGLIRSLTFRVLLIVRLSTFRSLPVLLLGYRPASMQQTCLSIVDHPGIAAQVDHGVLLRRRPSYQALFENRIDATHRSVPLGVACGRWAAHAGDVLDHLRMLLAQPPELAVVHELIAVTGGHGHRGCAVCQHGPARGADRARPATAEAARHFGALRAHGHQSRSGETSPN